MKRVVVFGTLAAFGIAAACDSESTTFRHGGGHDDDPSDGGVPGEGGEAPGGMSGKGGVGGRGGSSGSGTAAGRAGRGGSTSAGSGGISMGGTSGAGGAGARGGAGGSGGVVCGSFDCTRLPHVRPGAPFECRDGVCIIPPDSCEENFAHCSAFTSVGCEADLTSSENCGVCNARCTGTTPVCARDDTGWHCASRCNGLTPDACGANCTDLDTDPQRCGSCNNDCTNHNVTEADCVDGICTPTGPCVDGWGDCDTQFGCETLITTPMNCGACGRDNCSVSNATPDCSLSSGCGHAICDGGRGNCDRTSPDCEAAFGASCFPHYNHTNRVATYPVGAVVAGDGSYFLAGDYSGELDFNATLGVDRLTALGGIDCYITRFSTSGAYAGTLSFGGESDEYISAMGITADGSPVVAGWFGGPADLDPGPAEDVHDASNYGDWFVSKLSPSGALSWARVFMGSISITSVATDSSGAVYAVGEFTGDVDLNPGTGTSIYSSAFDPAGFIVKLDTGGNFAWARTVEGASSVFRDVAVASDGGVWLIGDKTAGAATILNAPLGDPWALFVVAFEPAGALRRVWALPNNGADAQRMIAAGNGAVHVMGSFSNSIDLDPGAATATRIWTPPYDDAFVVGLDLTGAYRDAHVWRENDPPVHVAALPDGGALVAVYPDLVEAFYPDGTSAWSLRVGEGGYFNSPLIATSSTHFIVVGNEDTAGDYDPGPGQDPIYGPTTLVSRYSF